MNKTQTVQIVLALTEVDMAPIAGTFTTSRGDGINAVPKMQTIRIAKACMWKRRGGEADIAKATAYAAQGGFAVYTFPTSERKPLEAAKARILAEAV